MTCAIVITLRSPGVSAARVQALPARPLQPDECSSSTTPATPAPRNVFEDVPRHELTEGKRPAVVFTTELTRLQRKVLRLLGMPKAYDT